MPTYENHGRLHKLLRGEMAAVQGYERALADLGAESPYALLQDFLEDHRRAVSILSRHVTLAGGEPDRTSGPWGAFVRLLEAAASWVDGVVLLKALKEGEVHGQDEYRTALAHDGVPAPLRTVIEGELLPLQHEHIEELDLLIARLERAANAEALPDRIHRSQPAR